MASLRDQVSSCLKTYLPYFERNDKDEFLYIANNTQLSHAVEKLACMIEEKFTSHNSAMDAIAEFDKAVRCLAVQLPESVWDDVNAKWQKIRQQHQ